MKQEIRDAEIETCYGCGSLEFSYHNEFPIVAFWCGRCRNEPCQSKDDIYPGIKAERLKEYLIALQNAKKNFSSGTRIPVWLAKEQFERFGSFLRSQSEHDNPLETRSIKHFEGR